MRQLGHLADHLTGQILKVLRHHDVQQLLLGSAGITLHVGQVIRKVTELSHGIEQQLVQLLIDYSPADVRRETNNGLLNGPQIHPVNKSDVVANQSQVDDLLDSLGF